MKRNTFKICLMLVLLTGLLVCRSLQSKDVGLLVSACEFLSDVVIQDFPAEVFLQRPSIIKVMSNELTFSHWQS